MENQIIEMFAQKGINCKSGLNSGLVNIVINSIDTIKSFGYAYWENSTSVGKITKEIIKSLL
jgi:hypothetical protein